MTGTDNTATDETTPHNELFLAADVLAAAYEGETYISTSRLIDPLLDLWSKATAVDPEVARPVEQMLTAYNSARSIATHDELADLAKVLRERASAVATN